MIKPINLRRPTYIVLDMPSALVARIRELRWTYGQDFESLPAEITLIGSSGVGVLDPSHSAEEVTTLLENIAAKTRPLKVQFSGMSTFPGSGVYFFPPISRAPFDELQASLLRAGLRCGPSPFPYTPHLTVVRIDESEVAKKILSVPAPEGEFIVDQLAVYSQEDQDTQLHYKTRLRGAGV